MHNGVSMTGMDTIRLNAAQMSCFTEKQGSIFVVLTNRSMAANIVIDNVPPYEKAMTISVEDGELIHEDLWKTIPERSHILTILPYNYFQSPLPELLGNNKQLAVMACHSTPTDIQAIQHFVRQAEKTDSQEQERLAERFFREGSSANHLIFEDTNTQLQAIFKHNSDALIWHEQIGQLEWGQQQLCPSGEISTLPVNVFGQNIESSLDINGELVLNGIPVLHGGSVSYLRGDQATIFNALSILDENPVVAYIVDGKVTRWEPITKKSRIATDMLEAMCLIDSRYETIIEVGFGINTNLELLPGNNAMNEVYGATKGAIHIGFGLVPFTQYHLDIICPNTIIKNDIGDVIFGR